jgi:hypothetical protein
LPRFILSFVNKVVFQANVRNNSNIKSL